jgi:hypothetical protein
MIVLYLGVEKRIGYEGVCMKRVLIFITALVLVIVAGITYGQRVVRLGDLPTSEVSINIYQVFGFQESYEGYKITYIDNKNEPQHLFLPVELLNKVRIYTPQNNTYSQNFLIIWKKENSITKVEWYKPHEVDYRLPYYSLDPFQEKDKEIFQKIVSNGEIVLGTELGGIEPTIQAPGGGQ